MSPSWTLAVATALLLTAVLGLEMLPGEAEHVPDTPTPSARHEGVTQGAKPAEAPPVAAWADIALARPLFAEDRRPRQVAQGGPIAVPRLAGIIRADRDAIAIFQPAAGKPLVASRGGNVADWTLTDITEGAVTLQRNGATTIVTLSYANLAVVAPPVKQAGRVVLHERWSNPFLQP
jgi:hypothetical protein